MGIYSNIIEDYIDSVFRLDEAFRLCSVDKLDDRTKSIIGQDLCRKISARISKLRKPSRMENFRVLATSENKNLKKIKMMDINSGYNLYSMPKDLKSADYEKYKNEFFENLMYCVILYRAFWSGHKFQIFVDDNKKGEFEIQDRALPHLLGVDNKYIGECALLETLMPGYCEKDEITQLLTIVKNYEAIKSYEEKSGVDIFNYYKCMQKCKNFLLFGKAFSNFSYHNLNKLHIVNNGKTTNQVALVKKTNMNKKMRNNPVILLLQMCDFGNFFAKSNQFFVGVDDCDGKITPIVGTTKNENDFELICDVTFRANAIEKQDFVELLSFLKENSLFENVQSERKSCENNII